MEATSAFTCFGSVPFSRSTGIVGVFFLEWWKKGHLLSKVGINIPYVAPGQNRELFEVSLSEKTWHDQKIEVRLKVTSY